MDLAGAFNAYQEGWVRQDWSQWQQTLAADYRFSTALGHDQDRGQTLVWSQAVFTAFPDYSQHVVDLTAAETVVAAELVCSGTSTGRLVTETRQLEPTGRRFTLRYCKIITFDHQAQVVRDHQYLDMLDLLRQLGYPGGRQ